MMAHFRHLRLRAITSDGTYGADLPLRRGLNILSAGNTTGKSTCLQAILYALGLERMLSPRREIPLAYVMREHVGVGGQARGPAVIESYVLVELENSQGESITVRRHVRGGPDWRLVSAWNRRLISDPSSKGEQRDFFVRDPGAARREAGFHPFLARFLGWQLPDVPTYDGDLVPLYMETIFPLLFVEQKAGWSTIQGPFPTYLGIQDVGRRVVEFLLDLDAQRVRISRHKLRRQLVETTQQWSETTAAMNRAAQQKNAKVEGVPNEPTGEFGLEPKISLYVYREGEWKQLREVLHDEQTTLDRLGRDEIPNVDEQAADLSGELERLRDRLDQTSALRDTVFEDMARTRAELNALQSRLSAVETDLQENKDALKLRNLGSVLGSASESGVCPTCHQEVNEELLPPIGGQVMAIEDNIRFLEAQRNLFRAMRGNARHRFDEREKASAALSSEISTIRARIRAVRSTLVAPSHSPSEAAIVERLSVQAWIEGHLQLEELVSELTQQLIDIAENFVNLKKALADLPEKDFSATDQEKIDRMRALIQDQLSLYHFKTYPPGLVFVSQDNFRPLVRIEGTNVESELGFEMSASDGIRMKWSYLLALLKLGREREMNHPGFVIFDEPRQQEADPVSFEALIRNASSYTKSGGQILFATSETPDDLRKALEGLDVNLIHYEGFLLQKIDGSREQGRI